MSKKGISTSELGRMIKQAEANGISPQHIVRLLKLYVGSDMGMFMSETGAYMQCQFNQLSRKVDARTPSEMIQAVMKSGWFLMGRVPTNIVAHYPLLWFASPMFLDVGSLDEAMKAENAPLEPVVKLTADAMLGGLFGGAMLQCENAAVNYLVNYTGVNNISLPGRKKQASSAAAESSDRQEIPATLPGQRLPSEAVRKKIVEDFLEQVRHSETLRHIFNGIQRDLTNPMVHGRPKKGARAYTQEEAREITRILMYDHVLPYFVNEPRFFKKNMSIAGRCSWLQTLLCSGYGKRMLSMSTEQFRRKEVAQHRSKQQNRLQQVRSNRPVSPHEWMDNDVRYYEDPIDGVTLIPADAPPRPDETVHWNQSQQKWCE